MLVLAATFTGRRDKKEDVLRLAASMLSPSRAEKGCITYNFYEQRPGDSQFLFFEEWESQAALDAHFKTPHFLDFTRQLPALIVGAPRIRVYDISGFREL